MTNRAWILLVSFFIISWIYPTFLEAFPSRFFGNWWFFFCYLLGWSHADWIMLKSRLWEVNLWLTATLCIFCAGFFLHWEVSRSFSCWKITHLKNQKTADCCRSGVSIFTSYWREEICGFSLKVTFFVSCFLFLTFTYWWWLSQII